jgi:TonB family protein
MYAPPSERQSTRLDLALSLAPGGQSDGTVSERRVAKDASALFRVPHPNGKPVPSPSAGGVSHGERPRYLDPRSTRDTVEAHGEPGATWEESWAADVPDVAVNAPLEGAGSQIGWDTPSRKLIRRRDPRFPAVLSALGQEVECEARITVAPSGGVTRVEITRSSGYTEIDAGVEAALRDYLFSRADGSTDAVGTVRFRFRLEKTD